MTLINMENPISWYAQIDYLEGYSHSHHQEEGARQQGRKVVEDSLPNSYLLEHISKSTLEYTIVFKKTPFI